MMRCLGESATDWGFKMSNEKASEVLNATPLAYECPKCHAPIGEPCINARGNGTLAKPHRPRTTKANDARTVLVVSFGVAYRLTIPGWRAWLVAHAAGKEPSLESYGVWVGQLENVTDLMPEDATTKLNELDAELEGTH